MRKGKRKSLVRKILVGLGIPTVFFPGLILASILGWNWQKDLARLAKTKIRGIIKISGEK